MNKVKNKLDVIVQEKNTITGNENILVHTSEIDTVNIFTTQKREFDIHKKICYRNLQMLSPTFTGRKSYIEDINKLLDKNNTIILCGSAGIGKTQIVLKYLQKFKNNYDHIAFINACNNESILQDYSELLEVENDENLIKRINLWSNENKNWLFIYDGFDDDKQKLPFYKKYMVEANGKIIITSQLCNWKEVVVQIGEFKFMESIKLLKTITKLNDNEGAKKLSEKLNNYPLALDQAGSYIKENNLSYDEYIELFESKENKMIILSENVPDIYAHSIFKTFEISLDKIESISSKELLYIISFLDNNIPKEIFNVGMEELSDNLKQDFQDRLTKLNIFRNLSIYSLIKDNKEDISINKLIQNVIRCNLNPNDKKKWFDVVKNILCKNFDYEYYDWNKYVKIRNLIPHILNFIKIASEFKIKDTKLSFLLNNLASLYKDQGEYILAEKYYNEALLIREKILGVNHLDTAVTYNNLGIVYKVLNNLKKAKEYSLKAFQVRNKLLGIENTDTATSLDDLGLLFSDLKEYKKAKICCEKALSIRELILGSEHPEIAISYNNLGNVYKFLKDYQISEDYYKKDLEISKKLLENHPDLAMVYNNLGLLYQEQKKYPQALKNYEAALKIREQILGKNHPATATSYWCIATIKEINGLVKEAKLLYSNAIKIYEKSFGREHHITNSVKKYLNNLS